MVIEIKKTLVVILAISLFGCGALHKSHLEEENATVELDKNGIILVSAQETHNGGTPYLVRFDFENLTTGEQYAASTSQFNVAMSRMKSDLDELEGIRGRVSAYELPPGEYAFNNWLINNGSGMNIAPKNPRIAKFQVEQGKIKYLGNLNMILDSGKNAFGVTIVSGGFPVIEDQFDRDVPIAKQRSPVLDSNNIEKDMIAYETR